MGSVIFSLWLKSGGNTPIIRLVGLPRQEVRKQELNVSPLELFQQLWFLRKHSFSESGSEEVNNEEGGMARFRIHIESRSEEAFLLPPVLGLRKIIQLVTGN